MGQNKEEVDGEDTFSESDIDRWIIDWEMFGQQIEFFIDGFVVEHVLKCGNNVHCICIQNHLNRGRNQ